MTKRYTIVRMLAAAGIGGLLVAGHAAPALATCTVTGDGTPFATIQAAVNAGALTIAFTGTCDPQVSISHHPAVSLVGTGDFSADNVITQGMSVNGSPGVWITNVQIGGDTSVDTGIVFSDGANVSVFSSTIQTTLQGVAVVRGSVASFFNSSIQGRTLGTSNANPSNVFAGDNSMIQLSFTTITMNENNAKVGTLAADRNSSLLLRGGNSVTNTGSVPAIQVFGNSSLRQEDLPLEGTSGDVTPDAIVGGMAIFGKSYADVRDATITGNVTVDLDSVFRVAGPAAFGSEPGDVSITGNITASRASGLAFGSSLITVTGNVTCSDGSSHMSGSPTITGTKSCTGF